MTRSHIRNCLPIQFSNMAMINTQPPQVMSKEEGQQLAYELQKRLVQCCIDFIREKKLNDVERVDFNADALHHSAEHGEWTPATDSCCVIKGYDVEYGFFEIGRSL